MAAENLAATIQDAADVEERWGSQRKQMKSALLELDIRKSRLAKLVTLREEVREVKVDVVFNPETRTVSEVRQDTGEVVLKRLPYPDEIQMDFDTYNAVQMQIEQPTSEEPEVTLPPISTAPKSTTILTTISPEDIRRSIAKDREELMKKARAEVAEENKKHLLEAHLSRLVPCCQLDKTEIIFRYDPACEADEHWIGECPHCGKELRIADADWDELYSIGYGTG